MMNRPGMVMRPRLQRMSFSSCHTGLPISPNRDSSSICSISALGTFNPSSVETSPVGFRFVSVGLSSGGALCASILAKES